MKRERERDVAAEATAVVDRAVVKRIFFEHHRLGLLDLPLELLDEIARYLKRGEAVKCLTVCSTLHGAFARRVWQSIEEHLPNSHVAFPTSAWSRYGHLVRYIYINSRCVNTILFKSIFNVTRLMIPCHYLESVLGNEDIHELFKLQHIDFAITMGSIKVELAELVNCFSSRANARGQLVTFQWTLDFSSRGLFGLLCEMASKLTNAFQHSFDVGVYSRDETGHAKIAALSPVINRFSIPYNTLYRSIIIDESGIFPRLTHLRIVNKPFKGPPRYSITKFTPNQFPALQYLRISYTKGCNSAIEPMFDHAWSTVTKFNLIFCDNGAFFDRVIQQLPNVTELIIIGCNFSADIHAIATHLPHLQSLHVVINKEEMVPRLADGAVFANLIKLELKYEIFGRNDFEWLTFTLKCAPNLRTIRVRGRILSRTELKECVEGTNHSVRLIKVIPRDESNVLDSLMTIDIWTSHSPRTKVFKVPYCGKVNLTGAK